MTTNKSQNVRNYVYFQKELCFNFFKISSYWQIPFLSYRVVFMISTWKCVAFLIFIGTVFAKNILIHFPIATLNDDDLLVTTAVVLADFGHNVTIVSSLTSGVAHARVKVIHIKMDWDSYGKVCYTDAMTDADEQLWKNEKFINLYENRDKLDVVILREMYNGFVLPILNGSAAELILFKEYMRYPADSWFMLHKLVQNKEEVICKYHENYITNQLNYNHDPGISEMAR